MSSEEMLDSSNAQATEAMDGLRSSKLVGWSPHVTAADSAGLEVIHKLTFRGFTPVISTG